VYQSAITKCLAGDIHFHLYVYLQIKEKLMHLVEKRKEMMLKWDDRWDWLRLCKSTNVSIHT